MSFRILVADAHPVVCAGLFSFFADTDAQIVAVAHTCEQIIARTLEHLPDVLLLDANFPDGSGFEAVQTLRDRKFVGKVVFFEATGRQTYLARAVACGADSYLLKSATREMLLGRLRNLMNQVKGTGFGQDFSGELQRVLPYMRRRSLDALNPLTERESQVLRHIALGLSNKEIARSLNLSIDTVKEHVQNILRKLDVNDRTQAAVWAVKNKQIP
ncbi:MAG: LuxR C-terminal-related transcriptional regulator [Thermoguttaceae bacterium]|jgi:DNA-binding NarL/FixJ family response regulator